jgi:hypothetical protein
MELLTGSLKQPAVRTLLTVAALVEPPAPFWEAWHLAAHARALFAVMNRFSAVVLAFALALGPGATGAEERAIRVGLASVGPISAQTAYAIEQIVAEVPNVKVVPIQPHGGVESMVMWGVAGDADDRLDAIMVVSLPADSFRTEHEGNQATFTGTYEIWTLNLSTLEEDRHAFTVSDTETVVSGVGAILAVPAQFISERATGQKLIAGNVWQAYEAVRGRVEAKLVAATRLYLPNSPLKRAGPLNPFETAQKLIERGDGETAMAVFRSIGIDKPEVQRMIAGAQRQLARARASKLLGQTLGSLAGGDPKEAATLLASYESEAGSDASRAAAIRNALNHAAPAAAQGEWERVLRADVPALDHAGFVAMVGQLFRVETGAAPSDVVVSAKSVRIRDQEAPAGLKKRLDAYAAALSKAARFMSIKCGCDADAQLVAEVAGAPLLKARFGPSFTRPEVGLP